MKRKGCEMTKNDVSETNEDRSITPKMIAAEIGCDPKAIRAFVRKEQPNRAGRGGSWGFTADEAERIKRAFANRSTKRATAPAFDDSFGMDD